MKVKKRLASNLQPVIGDIIPSIRRLVEEGRTLLSIQTASLIPGKYQPRRVFKDAELLELAESIKEQGIIQPIIVRLIPESFEKYEIIAGERRWRAAKLAGLTKVPVVVSNFSDEVVLAASLIENIQRENLNPIEEAEALNRLITECNITHEEVSKRIGKPRSSITNSLRLLNLAPDVQKLLINNVIQFGHAKVLLSLDIAQQIEAARQIEKQNLNVRQTEKLVKRINSTEDASRSRLDISTESERLLRDSEQAIFDLLEIENTIKMNRNGKGCIKINFESEKELKNIIRIIGDKVK